MTMTSTKMTSTKMTSTTMTKRTSNKWLPALLVTPVAAGIFGVSTSWAATHDPMATESQFSQPQNNDAKLEQSDDLAGVPASTSQAIASNQETIDSLTAQLKDVQSQIS